MTRQGALTPDPKEVFRMLVSAQDMVLGVAESRAFITHRFGIPEVEVPRIEEEGVAKGWPPL